MDEGDCGGKKKTSCLNGKKGGAGWGVVSSPSSKRTHTCHSKGYCPCAGDSALVAMDQLSSQLNEGHRHEECESPNCCLCASGAADDHFPLPGLNVRAGPTKWSCQLHVHHFCFYMFTWAEH